MANTVLHFWLRAGIYGAVISKPKVSQHSLFHNGDSLESPLDEQFAVHSLPEPKTILTSVEGICQHGCKRHAKQGGC